MGMVVLLVVIGAVAAAAVGARVPRRDDRSIAKHHDALDHLASAVARAHAGVPAPTPRARRSRARVIRQPVSASRAALARWRSRLPRQAMAAASGVLVVAGLSVFLVSKASTGDDGLAAPSTTSTSAPEATATTTATTTPAAATPVAPQSADERGAVFLTGPSISVQLVARGRCWIGVEGGDGTQTFQGTLEPGQQRRIEGAGPLQVRLGNPTAVEVFVGGAPALVPAQEGRPFDLTFSAG